MMKRKLMSVVAILMFSVIFGLFSKDQALAYWSVSKDGKTQCFAIQYKYASKYKNEGKAAQDGNVSETSTSAQLYSTKKICGAVDANGNLSGKVTINGFPDSTSHIVQTDEKLGYSISNKGDTYTLTISTCSKSGIACDSGRAVTKTTYEIKKGEKFESFAESAFNGAPGKYGINAKAEFKKNETRETVKEEAEAMNPGESSNDGDGSLLSNVKETCANQGGAQSLGWILCPIMELIGEASDHMYEEYVEPALRVDPKLFSDDNQSVRIGWNTFRDIANIIFVILLLVVIFSQLTGVGIDNYGIKKILPKLIVAAVLINLSFIICVLAVDISNILGNSFQALFNELGNTLPTAEDIEIADNSIITGSEVTAGGRLASVGILSSAVVAGGMMWRNPAIILSLFVSAIGVAISVVFLFIILAVREAAVVVLIVISPVAMVCYMLPNAKKFFDRWFKGFQGLLLVYPICGLLVGGGDYVAKLLLTNGFIQQGFISAFTAMIAGIVPIFFIPMVLKNSFAALGNIGGMISNIGRGASRRATGRMRESGIYKNTQATGLERQARILGGLDKDGNPTTGFRRTLGTVFSGGRRNRQRNALNYRNMLNERGSLEATEGEDFMLGVQAGNILKEIEADGTINNDHELRDRLASALLSNDRPAIKAYTDALSAKGESGRDLVAEAYNLTASRMSRNSYDTFMNNIRSNHAAEYKDNQRSLFEAGHGQTTTEYANSAEGRAQLMTKAKAGTLGAMDDSEFARTFLGGANYVDPQTREVNTGNVDISSLNEEQRLAVGENAFNALKNAQNMDTNRVAYLQEIVKQSGYKASPQDVNFVNGSTGTGGGGSAGGTSIDVPHGRGSTPTNIGGGGGADFVSE